MVSEPGSRASVAADRNRLDEALVERGLAESRSRARALIMAGDVLVNGATVTRAEMRPPRPVRTLTVRLLLPAFTVTVTRCRDKAG